MTDFVLRPGTKGRQECEDQRPPLRPRWLQPSSAAVVVLAHLCFFAAFMTWVRPEFAALGAIDAELVREGDFIDAEAIEANDGGDAEAAIVPEVLQDAAFALPPPLVMEPETPTLPAKPEAAEKAKKTEQKSERNESAAKGGERREGQAGRRAGLPGGRGTGAGASQATCLASVAASMRRHMPGSTSLGPGTAFVTFYVNVGGGISGVSASGSTPAHAALARRIVASSRGLSSCGSVFASQRITFE